MEITENLELDAADIEKILDPYLRSYRFYSKGLMPEKIILAEVSKVRFQSGILPPTFEEIPVVFKAEPKKLKATVTVESEEGTSDAPSGPERAEQHSGATKQISSSDGAEPQPN